MSKFFINRPIVAMVISIITVIVGLVTLFTLPIAQFPKIIPPEIFVEAHYVGADAKTIEQSVATPIEQAQLPADMRNYGVTVQKSLTSPFLFVALSSPNKTYDAKFLANYAYINLNDELTRVPGIASVTVFGAGQYAMRLWVKPDQLAKLNITVPEIIAAVNKQNTVNPAGKIGGEPAPAGNSLIRLAPRAGSSPSRNLVKSFCAPTRMARWCGLKTWPAWSWLRRITTSWAG